MNKTQKFFTWVAVIWDAMFLLLTGSGLAYDYYHPRLWAIVVHLLMLIIWTYWFIQDTENLRRR